MGNKTSKSQNIKFEDISTKNDHSNKGNSQTITPKLEDINDPSKISKMKQKLKKEKTAKEPKFQKNSKILYQHQNIHGIILFLKYYMSNFQKCQTYIL